MTGRNKNTFERLLHSIASKAHLEDGFINYDETEFEKLLKLLLEKWESKFSKKYIERNLKGFIQQLQPDSSEAKAKDLLDGLDKEFRGLVEEQIVLTPIHGLRLDISPFVVGNVELKIMSPEERSIVHSRIEQIISNTLHSAEDKKILINDEFEEVDQILFGKVYSEFHIVAESDRALERAIEETRRALELPRLSLPLLNLSSRDFLLGLQTELADRFQHSWTIANGSYSRRFSVTKGFLDFYLSQDRLSILEKVGMWCLNKIIQKPKPDTFEQMILKGVHWFSSSQLHDELENRLLNLVTCLEVMFTPLQVDGYSIRAYMGECVALILASDLEKRIDIKTWIVKFYDERSSITHAGSNVALSENDVNQLELRVCQLITWMLNHPFPSRDEFHKWLRDQRLSPKLNI